MDSLNHGLNHIFCPDNIYVYQDVNASQALAKHPSNITRLKAIHEIKEQHGHTPSYILVMQRFRCSCCQSSVKEKVACIDL